MIADLGLAFAAGLLSCASACVLPLLPTFVAYLGGVSLGSGARPPRRWTPVAAAGLFVAGFGTAFIVLGAGAGLVGGTVASYRPPLVTASGLLLCALGLTLVAGLAGWPGLPWLTRERRFHVAHRLPRTPAAAYVIGLTFAVGWTPCVGPVLAAILVEAANTATAGRGAVLLASYSAGLGLPFLAVAACVPRLTGLLGRGRGGRLAIDAAAAVLLLAMGVLTLGNRLTVLNGFVPSAVQAQTEQLATTGGPASIPQSTSPYVGRQAPLVTVTGVDRRRLALRDLRGRPVLVTFWATWCVPCRDDLPIFDAAARAHRDLGLTVVPIDYRESAEAVTRFWRELGLHIVPYLDPDGAAARSFGVGLQETGLPVTALVDRQGTVRSIIPGQVGPDLLASRLDEILQQTR